MRQIALLPPAGIGDVLFCMPALDALRHAFPPAHITLLGPPWAEPFFSGRPGPVDEVVVPPPVTDPPAAHPRFFEAMRSRAFDVAVQAYGGGRESNTWIRELGAAYTIGSRAEDADALDASVPYRYYQNEVERRLELVGLLGVPPVTRSPRVSVTERDLEESRSVSPPDPHPLAVLLPGAGDPRRHWPAGSFAEVGRGLRAEGATVAVCGSEADRSACAEIARASGCLDLSATLSLGGLAGLLSRAAVVVGNDTGPLHLAEAVGAATVGVYWFGNVINAAPPGRARNRVAISWRRECPTCGVDCTLGRCGHSESFVADVGVAEVLGEALDLLEIARRA